MTIGRRPPGDLYQGVDWQDCGNAVSNLLPRGSTGRSGLNHLWDLFHSYLAHSNELQASSFVKSPAMMITLNERFEILVSNKLELSDKFYCSPNSQLNSIYSSILTDISSLLSISKKDDIKVPKTSKDPHRIIFPLASARITGSRRYANFYRTNFPLIRP